MTYQNSENSVSFLTKNMGIFVAVLFTFLQLIGALNLRNMDSIALISILFVFITRWVYLVKFSDISLNPSRLLLWSSWDFSLIVLPTLLYSDYIQTYYQNSELMIMVENVNFCISIGGGVLAILFFSSIWKVNSLFVSDNKIPTASDQKFYAVSAFLFVVIITCIALAKLLGTAIIGTENVYLPFKMSGIINFLAFYFPTFYFLYLLDNVYKRGFSIFWVLGISVIICGAQMYVSLSKATFLFGLTQIFVYVLIARKFKNAYMLPLSILFILAFTVGSFMSTYRDSTVLDLKTRSITDLEAGFSATAYVHRIFAEGVLLQKFNAYSKISDTREDLKDFNYHPSYVHTYAIDRTPPTMLHSSGSAPLAGAYLFGVQYVFLTALILGLLAMYFDYNLPRLKSVFSNVMMRSYLVYFVFIYLLNAGLPAFVHSLLTFNGFSINVAIPMLLIFITWCYLKFGCKNSSSLRY